jgi:hypothetical protein
MTQCLQVYCSNRHLMRMRAYLLSIMSRKTGDTTKVNPNAMTRTHLVCSAKHQAVDGDLEAMTRLMKPYVC